MSNCWISNRKHDDEATVLPCPARGRRGGALRAVNRVLRFIGFAGMASVVVTTLMIGALWAFGLFDRPEESIDTHPVELLSTSDRVDIAALLGQEARELPERRPVREIEPLVIPAREVTGFVQLEVAVDETGRVRAAEVVNALPAGVYEDRALDEVRQRRYPARPGGARRIEVVRFSVSPDELPDAPPARPPE